MTNVCLCVDYRNGGERKRKKKKERKSQLSLLMTICQSSSFPAPPLSSRCLPPHSTNPSTRTAHPSPGHPISATYKVTHFTYLSWLFLSFFCFEGVSVYARASLPIYNFFFYLSNGGKVNTGVGGDVSRIKACDDIEVCLLWSVISAPQCSPCHGCLRL